MAMETVSRHMPQARQTWRICHGAWRALARKAVVGMMLVIGAVGMNVCCPAAWAEVTLSVSVVRGGLDMDFGSIEAGEASRTEELELTLTSTGGAQYRVYQELPGLLINERGDRLPEGKLVMQISRGVTGTRGHEGIVAVTQPPQEIFVSNPSGTSDTLLVAYSIPPVPDLSAGSYRGLLRFTVESLDTGAMVTQTVTVHAVVVTVFRLERRGTGAHRVELGEIDPGERSSIQELVFDIVNNTAAPTQVVQELGDPLSDGRGDTLPKDALAYTIVSNQGSGPWRSVAVSPEVALTDERGELQDFRIAYAVTIPSDQPAGAYQGSLRLRLVNLGTSAADELWVPLEVTVREVFTMSVQPIDGGGETLHFNPPLVGDGAVERSLVVEIRTNMGRPYQVLAGLDHPLVLGTGEVLPSGALVWSLPKTEHGAALIEPNTPVAIGYEPLYQSDAKGSPDSFILTYRLTVPPDARSGLYSGQLRFTITMF
jgi:hypothetical protein